MSKLSKSYQKVELPLKYGLFVIYVWQEQKGREPIALVTKTFDPNKPVFVRVHSECFNGDVVKALTCDCGEQKEKSLQLIARSGNGIFIYDRQEGRGIGLYEKVKALALQSKGFNTYDANLELGHEPDCRCFDIAVDILKFFKVKTINLITNNPKKINDLTSLGINISEKISIETKENKYNQKYLKAKKIIGGHMLSV